MGRFEICMFIMCGGFWIGQFILWSISKLAGNGGDEDDFTDD